MDRREDRIIELENQIAELKRANAKLMAQVEDFRSKEQTISSAIISSMEHANQLEASRKKLYSLDIQRSSSFPSCLQNSTPIHLVGRVLPNTSWHLSRELLVLIPFIIFSLWTLRKHVH